MQVDSILKRIRLGHLFTTDLTECIEPVEMVFESLPNIDVVTEITMFQSFYRA